MAAGTAAFIVLSDAVVETRKNYNEWTAAMVRWREAEAEEVAALKKFEAKEGWGCGDLSSSREGVVNVPTEYDFPFSSEVITDPSTLSRPWMLA